MREVRLTSGCSPELERSIRDAQATGRSLQIGLLFCDDDLDGGFGRRTRYRAKGLSSSQSSTDRVLEGRIDPITLVGRRQGALTWGYITHRYGARANMTLSDSNHELPEVTDVPWVIPSAQKVPDGVVQFRKVSVCPCLGQEGRGEKGDVF